MQAFPDVPATNWAAKYIAYCKNAGYIGGDQNGNFLPTTELSGYAFGKMVLCVLGYDANIEGFTGSTWSINIARLMQSNKITDGIDTAASLTLTREQAAQYCLNALKATMVEYESKGTQISINGATIASGASTAKAVTVTADAKYVAIDNTKDGAKDIVQLGEKLYSGDLKIVSATAAAAGNDSNGHKAHKWTYKTSTGTKDVTGYLYDDSILGSSSNGDALFNSNSGKKSLAYDSNNNASYIAKLNNGPDLNGTAASTTKLAANGFRVFVNGTEVDGYYVTTGTSDTVVGATANNYYYHYDVTSKIAKVQVATNATTLGADINGKGVLIEVADADSDGDVDAVYYTVYTVAQLSKAPTVKVNSNDGKDYVYIPMSTGSTIGASSPTSTGAVKASNVTGYEGLAKDDYVTVAAYADGTYVLTKSEPTNGVATALKSSTYTIDSTAKDTAKNALAFGGNVTFNATTEFYYDAYGYLIAAEKVDTSGTNYLMVIENGSYASSSVSGASNKSYVVFDDGTTKTIEVSKLGSTKFSSGSMTVPTTGVIYKYVEQSDGTYALTVATTARYVYNTTDVTRYGTTNGNLFGTSTVDANGTVTKGYTATSGTYYSNTSSATTTDIIRGDASTVYIYRDVNAATTNAYNSNYKTSWTTYTGYKNAKTVTAASMSAIIGSDGYADVVYVYNWLAGSDGTVSDYLFLLSDTPTAIYDTDGLVDYYEYAAVVDGAISTVKATTNDLSTSGLSTSGTIASPVLCTVNYTDGKLAAGSMTAQTTSATTSATLNGVSTGNEYKWNVFTTNGTKLVVSLSDSGDLLQFTGSGIVSGATTISGSDSFGFASDCKVFVMDNNGDNAELITVEEIDGSDNAYTKAVAVTQAMKESSPTATQRNTIIELYLGK